MTDEMALQPLLQHIYSIFRQCSQLEEDLPPGKNHSDLLMSISMIALWLVAVKTLGLKTLRLNDVILKAVVFCNFLNLTKKILFSNKNPRFGFPQKSSGFPLGCQSKYFETSFHLERQMKGNRSAVLLFYLSKVHCRNNKRILVPTRCHQVARVNSVRWRWRCCWTTSYYGRCWQQA